MAKGIPVVVNEFFGSRDIWFDDILYQTHDEAIRKIKSKQGTTNRVYWRNIIESKYSVKKMLKEYGEFLGT